MNEQQYIKITSYFRKTKLREKIVIYLCKYTPLIVVFCYFATLTTLLISKSEKLILFLLIPATNFIFITFLRKILNRPRPYDVFNHIPLVKYTPGKGKSFPSRHTSSAFIIAISYFYINYVYLGLFMLIVAIIIGLSRIIAGVHFPKDIIAAIIISIIWAFIGFNI
ncbi:phosphatase PAP2 family protein [Clostridium butyricum]|uniref:Undecaprenyl-diphosphatase BcrC n=1 Tax=Clostridium butyricum TaxID=1492 RepID=A0A6N2ZMF6_CLOBU